MGLIVQGLATFPGSMPSPLNRFVNDFTAVELPWLRRSGIEIAGGWVQFSEGRVQLLNLYRFASLGAMELAGARQRRDAAAVQVASLYGWMIDPEFRYTRTVWVVSKLMRSISQVSNTGVWEGGNYVRLLRRIRFAPQDAARSLMVAEINELAAEGKFHLVMAYEALFGEHGSFSLIGRVPSERSVGPRSAPNLRSSVSGQLEALIAEEAIYTLQPLPYSPIC